jgi:integration host factor subunit beta
MIKSQLIDRIAVANLHLQKTDADKIVSAFLDCIADAMTRGERVELRGFGSFSVKVQQAGPARNPKTGAPVSLPRRVMPRFKAAKEMHSRLNGQKAAN